jgi:hydrogenase nickel incorporation protein HypA/HybF
MHEFSVASALLKQVAELAVREGAERITQVRVSVGEFSGVEPELLRLAFEQLIPGSPADGAQVMIEPVSLQAGCRRCETTFAVASFRFQCPECGSPDVRIVQGEELILESVTLETEE